MKKRGGKVQNKCGIYSLRGYLYQIIVFAREVLKNICYKSNLIYEGEEDIDIKDSSFATINTNDTLIQVKSGNVTNSVLYSVVANWLLLDSLNDKNLVLIYEKGSIKLDDDFYKSFCSYISNPENRKKSTKFAKCFEVYNSNKEFFTDNYNFYIKKANIEKLEKETLFDSLKTIIKTSFSIKSDIKCERFAFNFCKEISLNIFEHVLNSNNYVCSYSDYNDIITKLLDVIKSDKYIFELEKYDNLDFDNLINKMDESFMEQIKLVNRNKAFVLQNMKLELEYELFRESVEENDLKELNITERTAKSNWQLQCGNTENTSPNKLYFNTVCMRLDSNILHENNDSRVGCYNYLTTSKCDDNVRIKWEIDEDEII